MPGEPRRVEDLWTAGDQEERELEFFNNDDIMDAPNDVTVTTGGGNNSWAIPEAF